MWMHLWSMSRQKTMTTVKGLWRQGLLLTQMRIAEFMERKPSRFSESWSHAENTQFLMRIWEAGLICHHAPWSCYSLTPRQGSSVDDECVPGNVNCWNIVKTSQCVTARYGPSFQWDISLRSEIRENLHAVSTASKNCAPRNSSLFKTPVGWCNNLFRTYPSLFITHHFKSQHNFQKKKKTQLAD